MSAYRIPRWISRYWKAPPGGGPDENDSETNDGSGEEAGREVGRAPPEPIAVIGMSAALPMAADLDAFWDNLLAGRDCVTEVPADRRRPEWSADDPAADATENVRQGGFIAGIDEFDSLFFNISPREAALMDPHQRLLMMHAWRTIEDAGHAPRSLAGTDTGVFVGFMGHDYVRLVARADRPAEGYTSTGMLSSITSNRISHFLDLRGPNESIDTACSSSLVALHRAVRAIQGGECRLAIAGGVHLLLTPFLHSSFERAGMLSKDGRCKTFSSDANGYVRSEGVGLVLLKALSDAERDGDRIHCVIRATVENHGGASRSLTAPNPQAQADLVYRAYAAIDADPSTIGYIECHGTGTPLGDPIEVEALKCAFDRLHERHGSPPVPAHCGLGSVKGNIGHLEIAAGIAGLIKVVLQLQHGTLVPTLHSRPRNPYVVTDDTPFYIVEQARPWPQPSPEGARSPRRAGVSSFGFGGVNAHVVVEEHLPKPRTDTGATNFPVVLSARNAAALRRQVAALRGHALRRAGDRLALLDAAYTLCCGRESMAYRLGFVVEDWSSLIERLDTIDSGLEDDAIMRGQVDVHSPADRSDAPSAETLARALRSPDAAQSLVRCWVRGGFVDWQTAFRGESVRRASLPGYVFEPVRFPLPHAAAARQPQSDRQSPLRLFEAEVLSRRIDVVLDGEESFLADHVVGGHRLLPAAMSLELVRAASETGSASGSPDRMDPLRFEDLRWHAPFIVDARTTLSLWLHAIDGGGTRFEVGVHTAGQSPQRFVATGKISPAGGGQRTRRDPAEASARCGSTVLSAQQCYDAFSAMGFVYGPAHRTIQGLRVGDGEAVAALALDLSGAEDARGFVLDPAVLDGALQAVIGFHLDPDTPWSLTPTSRPAGCARVDVLQPAPLRGWAILRMCEPSDDQTRRRSFDIDVCDHDGTVCVRFLGLTIATGRDDTAQLTAASSAQALFVAPSWLPVEIGRERAGASGGMLILGGSEEDRAAFAAHDASVRTLGPQECADEARVRDALAMPGGVRRLIWLVDADLPASLADEAILQAQSRGVFRCLALSKALLAEGYGGRALDWLVVTRGSVDGPGAGTANPVHAGLQGMVGVIARERPDWRPRLLDLAPGAPLPLQALLDADFAPGPVLAYRNRRWHVRRLCPVDPPPAEPFAIAAGAVCLIIGGGGGLGRVFSEALLRQVPELQLVWMGRRPREALRSSLDELAPLGRPVHYIQGDAADPDRLAEARREIEIRFGRIDGLIHAAMVLADRSVDRLTEQELREALAPKVDACVRLAAVFDPDRLAFALFFSSLNAFATLPGQSNYAAASCFEDAFALAWGAQASGRVRIVNWGYWGDVGAVATDFHRARMVRAGLASIQGPEAVAAAWRMLNAPLRQYGYLQAAPSADLEALGIEPRFHLGLAESSVAVEDTDAGWIPGENAAIDDAEMLATDADALDRAIVDALHAQLSRLSLPSPSTAPQTRDAVRIAAGIVDDYRPWFDRSLDELIRHGYLLEADGLLHAGPRAVDTAVDAGPAAARLPHSARNPALPAYVGAMLDAIPQIVTGQASAVDVAFSEPVSTWAADSYFHDPAVAHGSDVVAMIAAAHVARCAGARPGARVRLLEIGAGRGATTRRVVSALRPQENAVGEYLFTDVSAAFIGPDRRAALDLPGYVAYRTFDVERDPQAQGLPAGAFDIVIAANVLHATGDLERTLRHCALLLRRGGILLLQELTGNPLYAHVTYGLFEGWWRFSDPWQRLRGGPAAAPEAWQELLALTGFRNVRFPAPSLHPLWHQVVFAQSEGVLLRPAGAGVGATAAATTADEASAAGGMRAALPASTSVAVAAETEQGGDGQPRMDAILSGLKTVVAGVLGIEESVFDDESQSFAETLLTEYGMDSLSSINLRNALRARYGIEVPTQQLLGEKTSVIAGAIYNQLLMQRLVSRDAPADDTPSETFVF